MLVSFTVTGINGTVAMQLNVWVAARAAIACGITGGVLQPSQIILVSVIDISAGTFSIVLATDAVNTASGSCPAHRRLSDRHREQRQGQGALRRLAGSTTTGGAQYTVAITIPAGLNGTGLSSAASQLAAQGAVQAALTSAFNASSTEGAALLHGALEGANYFAVSGADSATATGASTSDVMALPQATPAAPASSSSSPSSITAIVAGTVVCLAIIATVALVLLLLRRKDQKHIAMKSHLASANPPLQSTVPGMDNPLHTRYAHLRVATAGSSRLHSAAAAAPGHHAKSPIEPTPIP